MKLIFKRFWIAAPAVALVLLITACGDKPGFISIPNPETGVDFYGNTWNSVSQGNTYTPIQIPNINWRGDTYELGGNSDAWNVNKVTTVRTEEGALIYTLTNDEDGEPYPVFDVLWVTSLADDMPGEADPTKISPANKSEAVPGVLFMYDHEKEITDNYYEANSLHETIGEILDTDTTLLSNDEINALLKEIIDEEASDEDNTVYLYPYGIGSFRANNEDDFIPKPEDSYYPGILKVHEAVFQRYIAFVLKIKYNNGGEKDFLIKPQRGQLRCTGDKTGREGDSYMFFIDEVTGELGDSNSSSYIIDAWVEIYIERETPVTPPTVRPEPEPDPPEEEDPNNGGTEPVVADEPDVHPDPEEDPYGTALINIPPEKIGKKFVIISTASEGAAEVDPLNQWKFSGKPIKNYWDDEIKAKNASLYNSMKAIKNSEDKTATWIWDRSDSWSYGISGCFTVITASRFDIGEDEEFVDPSIYFYFACDNACAVYVNGKLAKSNFPGQYGYTHEAFDKATNPTMPGDTSDWRFTSLDNSAFTGDDNAWDTLYRIDIKSLLTKGHNEILIMAANNDSSGGRWDDTNNPAGLLFACEFSVE